jgi:hypothetical protein
MTAIEIASAVSGNIAPVRQLQHSGDRVRQSGGDPGEDDDRDAVAQAALGHLLAQPHQEHSPGHQRHHGGDAEHQSRVDHQSGLGLERDRDARRLEQREEDGTVAGVLRDLALPRLPLLLELLELRRYRGHQLHDDRGRDVRHDSQGENREARKRSAREHVEQAEDAALLGLEQLGEPDRVDSRNGNVRADAEDDERQQQEDQPLLEIAVLAGFSELGSR